MDFIKEHRIVFLSLLLFLAAMIVSNFYSPWNSVTHIDEAVQHEAFFMSLFTRITCFSLMDFIQVFTYVKQTAGNDTTAISIYIFWFLLFFSIHKTVLDKIFHSMQSDLSLPDRFLSHFFLDIATFAFVMIISYHAIPALNGLIGGFAYAWVVYIVLGLLFVLFGGLASGTYFLFYLLVMMILLEFLYEPVLFPFYAEHPIGGGLTLVLAGLAILVVTELLASLVYRFVVQKMFLLDLIPLVGNVYEFFFDEYL